MWGLRLAFVANLVSQEKMMCILYMKIIAVQYILYCCVQKAKKMCIVKLGGSNAVSFFLNVCLVTGLKDL